LKSKPSHPPGLNPADLAPPPKANKDAEPMSKAAKKNAKRKEKKILQKESEAPIHGVTHLLAQTKISQNQTDSKPVSNGGTSRASLPEEKQEVLKKVRTLRKKLKQIEDLEKKIASGELKQPEKDQLEKIAKKQDIVDEMEDLQHILDN